MIEPAHTFICRTDPGTQIFVTQPFLSRLMRLAPKLFVPVAFITGLLLFAPAISAQHRDHLTEAETELVRFYQELDRRVEVFIKAIDRRFAIISGAAQPAAAKKSKDKDDWGEAPKGTRAELLSDIAGILDEAITNIDDVSNRDQKNPLISRSVRKLAAAANGYLGQFTAIKNQTTDTDELSAIERAADHLNQILEVGNKLPPPADESDKKKKKP